MGKMRIFDFDEGSGNIHCTLWDKSEVVGIFDESKIYKSKNLSAKWRRELKEKGINPKHINMREQCESIELQFLISNISNCETEIKEIRESWFYGKAGYACLRLTLSDNNVIDITPYRMSVIDGKPECDFEKWQIVARDVTYKDKYKTPKFEKDSNETSLNADETNASYFPKLDGTDNNIADRMDVVEALKHFAQIDAQRQIKHNTAEPKDR